MDFQRDAEQINDYIFCWTSAWFRRVRRSEIVHNAPVAWLSHRSLQGSLVVSNVIPLANPFKQRRRDEQKRNGESEREEAHRTTPCSEPD